MEEGYTNSQTWEAWKDSFNVLWDNTEIVFLISVTVSLGAVFITWLFYPRENVSSENVSQIGLSQVSEELTNYDSVLDEDVIEETLSDEKLRSNVEELRNGIENSFTVEEKNKEREAQNQQLEAIFKLMQEQQERFGDTSIDDIKDQMKFYSR